MSVLYGSVWTGTWKSGGTTYSRQFRAYCNYTFDSNYSNTQAKLVISSAGIQKYSGNDTEFASSNTSYVKVTVSGAASYTTTGNKGSSTYYFNGTAPQNKNYPITAKTIYINKSTSSQSVKIAVYGCKTNGGWQGSSSGNVTLTIPVKKYAISFNANGGSGAPSAQTKTHGTALTLSTTVPARVGYDFLGWSTTSTATVPEYRYGASHTVSTSFATNANTTLYAVWNPSFVPPVIADLRAYRVDTSASGYDPNVTTNGTRCYADFNYTAPSNTSGSETTTITFGSTTISNLSESGTYLYAYTSDGHLALSTSEDVVVTISGTKYTYDGADGNTYGGDAFSYSYQTFISKEAYVWDAYKDSSGYQAFAVGQLAREEEDGSVSVATDGDFDVYFRTTFINDIYIYVDQSATGSSTIDGEMMDALTALGWDDTIANDGVFKD